MPADPKITRNRRKRCPFPVGDDGGSAAVCFERRHCGCQLGGCDDRPRVEIIGSTAGGNVVMTIQVGDGPVREEIANAR